MKTNHRFLVLALVLCGISACTNTQSFTYNGINYKVTSTSPREVKVANSRRYSGAAVIPASVVYNSNTYAVTAIGNSAFYNCSDLTSVIIPESVKTIGNKAFYECSGLTSVTIGNSVETIGHAAFSGCSGLTSVTIPNSVKTIENYAFSGCRGLTSVTIGNSVETIGAWAFEECSKLTSVTIGNSVETIGERAFSGCSGLTSVIVEDGTTTLSFGISSLQNCPVSTLYLGRNISYYSFGSNYDSPFESKTTLTSLTIGNSVTSIGDGAFYGCSGLTSVTIGNSVETIGNFAFSGCRGLTSVIIGNSVETIGERAFRYCSSLETIYVKAINPPAVGKNAFRKVPAGIPVYVPYDRESVYRSAAGWSSLSIR
ncbi:MAG: leucine-rich repeat domain-containing protein [Prevotellaceae bacterium]|jgi:hypothetical protein|nr:leucine-rich repeat domain-containing protein [Prevotellaceae bacterium]